MGRLLPLWLGWALLVAGGLARGAWGAEYGVGSWSLPANHRAVVRVAAPAEAVRVLLPWRRRDAEPQSRAVRVYDAAGAPVRNVGIPVATPESGEVVFQPTAGPGLYYVYYLLYETAEPWWAPQVRYLPAASQAEAAWLGRSGLGADGLVAGRWRELPAAELVRLEARSPFHRRDPMELPATAAELRALLAAHPGQPLLLFPERRELPIRMREAIPGRWAERGPGRELAVSALRNEYLVFQVGAFAAERDLAGLQVRFSVLRGPAGATIPAAALTCLNTEGSDWLGRRLKLHPGLSRGCVQALWCGVQVPPTIRPGRYRGTVTVSADGVRPQAVGLVLTVHAGRLADGGVGQVERLARLKWLNSTIGLDEQPTAPYTALEVEGPRVRCLGREVRLGGGGFLSSIRSGGEEVLAAPLAFTAQTATGAARWVGPPPRLVHRAPGAVAWETTRHSGPLSLHCQAKMESDGYLGYLVTLQAAQATAIDDLRLEIPLRRKIATYMMGLGRRGGLRPAQWQWHWDPGQAGNMVWIGDVQAGLQCKLKGPRDEWHLWGTEEGARRIWGNEGRGGCSLTEVGTDTVLLQAFTGPRQLAPGEPLVFRFGLLITPVKPLNPAHWQQRYIHEYNTVPAVAEVVANGANIVNIHQGNPYNPYINYPFLTADKLREYAAAAHARGVKVKIYYTVRELSNFTRELFALRSLGHEVFTGGGGGGDSWLQEHLVSDYAPAWHQPYANGEVDAALATVGLSRWHNYYLEGLHWLVGEVGIDGLYLDGIGYDREIMKRVRKVLDRARPGCLLDFHSGNSLSADGRGSSPANLYMEHFPYLDSLWFGEMYDYNLPPDYWLVEISGIPFGLYGEMLQDGGNPWRGMLYGMTNRLHWGGDPRALWKLWDDFGIAKAQMTGYWEPGCPVRTDQEGALATVYRREGRSLVSVASWAPQRVSCRLQVDWQALGLDPRRAHLYAPEIAGLQPARLFAPGDAVPVSPGRGWLLYLDCEAHEVPAQVDAYAGRRLLLEDDFGRGALGAPWTLSLSTAGGATLAPRDGALAIGAKDNCYAFAERPLPAGATLVQCRVDSGTDAGATWGPGLTVLWPGGRAIRLNIRSLGTFGVDDGTDFVFAGHTAPRETYWLRLRLEPAEVVAEASVDGEYWEVLHRYARERYPGSPVAVRLGKSGPGGRAEDYTTMARPGTCAVGALRVYGGP